MCPVWRTLSAEPPRFLKLVRCTCCIFLWNKQVQYRTVVLQSSSAFAIFFFSSAFGSFQLVSNRGSIKEWYWSHHHTQLRCSGSQDFSSSNICSVLLYTQSSDKSTSQTIHHRLGRLSMCTILRAFLRMKKSRKYISVDPFPSPHVSTRVTVPSAETPLGEQLVRAQDVHVDIMRMCMALHVDMDSTKKGFAVASPSSS